MVSKQTMRKKTFHLISLGCAKNTVDSDSMAQLLSSSGYSIEEDSSQAGVVIVNTCGFIDSAREESLQVLKELAGEKRKDQYLIAAGCLSQRYGHEITRQVPGIDGIIGTRRWMDIVDLVERLRAKKHPEPVYHLPESPKTIMDHSGVLRVSLQGTSAYIKIADGCRRPCAFCSIPLIKGSTVSRPAEAIIEEAMALQNMGARELILIAQDTTDYGHDLGVKNGLADLLERLVEQLHEQKLQDGLDGEGVEWIRIMYAYPGYVTDRLIEVMAAYPQVIPYLDMPLQHADPRMLRRMRRPANIEWVHRTLKKMRDSMPDLALRTTFIVGYPGETEQEFETLLDFIEEVRFDRVGAFKFSFEPGTASESLGDPISPEVKQDRWERLMALQQQISLEINQQFIGQTMDVLIEGSGDGLSMGRTYRDAPEIDGLTILEGEHPLGEIIPVRITGALTYDLSGVALGDSSMIPLATIEGR